MGTWLTANQLITAKTHGWRVAANWVHKWREVSNHSHPQHTHKATDREKNKVELSGGDGGVHVELRQANRKPASMFILVAHAWNRISTVIFTSDSPSNACLYHTEMRQVSTFVRTFLLLTFAFCAGTCFGKFSQELMRTVLQTFVFQAFCKSDMRY